MSSFQSFLHVGGKKYEILYSDLLLSQAVDTLGRPASPTFGGIFTVKLNMFGSDDPTLAEPTQGDIDAGRGDPDRRAYDTEVKILEDVLDKTNADSTGEITIVLERAVCPSCKRAALEQFQRERPNIKIILVEAERPNRNDSLPHEH